MPAWLANLFSSFSTSDAIAFIALIISFYVAYESFWAKFKGRLWFSEKIIVLCVDNIPSICLPCFIENSGAKEGALDDMRIIVETPSNGVSCVFYPVLMKDNYNIIGTRGAVDGRQFGTVLLPPKYRKETYIFFKPQNDVYRSVEGDMTIKLQIRWHGENSWKNVGTRVSFLLTAQVSQYWNDPSNLPIQVSSKNFMELR